jgi:hypothetical protein
MKRSEKMEKRENNKRKDGGKYGDRRKEGNVI